MAGDKLDVVIKCRGILGCLPTIQSGRVSKHEDDGIQWRYKKKEGTVTITFDTPPPLKVKNGPTLGTTVILNKDNNWTSGEYEVNPDILIISPVPYSYTIVCSDCLLINPHIHGGGDPEVIIEP